MTNFVRWPWPILPAGELEMLVSAKAASGWKGLNRSQQLARVIIIVVGFIVVGMNIVMIRSSILILSMG